MTRTLLENYDPAIRQARALETNFTINSVSATAPVAGGSAVPAISIGTLVGPNVYFGSGAPTISAPQGSLYLNSTGSSTSTRMYINTTGSTTWTAVTTAG